MTEHVTRHRGRTRDSNGKLTPEIPDEPLTSTVIGPGGGSEYTDSGRDGESIACTVYFALGTDIKNGDQLTVRDEKFNVIVNDWNVSGQGIMEVLCTRNQG